MHSVLLASNLVAALFIFVIIVSLYEVPKEVLKTTRLFRICTWITLLGLIVEMATDIFDGKAKYGFLLIVLNLLAFVLVDVITIVYSFYLDDLVDDKERRFTNKIAYVITVLCSIEIVYYIVGVITGNLFTIEEGLYVKGPWGDLLSPMSILSFFLICFFYVFKYKTFKIKSKFFVILIVFVPAMSMIVLYLAPGERFAFLGTAVSMNVIYAVLESKIIAEAVTKAKMYNEISEKDMLTGLKNRRGYQTVLDGCYEDEKVGIAFVDVNSLKYVNDNEGHEAGDNLIKRVAGILKEAAPEAIACRISGDEFVCIIRNAETDSFAHTMKHLEGILAKNDRIAAFGYDIGAGSEVYSTIKNAEQMMYADKERYYKETGKDRRR